MNTRLEHKSQRNEHLGTPPGSRLYIYESLFTSSQHRVQNCISRFTSLLLDVLKTTLTFLISYKLLCICIYCQLSWRSHEIAVKTIFYTILRNRQ